jgi:hypothetical protein
MRRDVSFSFQAIQSGVHRANRDLTVSAEFYLLTYSDPIGAIFQPQEGQDNDVFEFTKVVAVTHYLYNIEQILGCQNFDSQIQKLALPHLFNSFALKLNLEGLINLTVTGPCPHRACIPASSYFRADGSLDIKVTKLAPRLILRVRFGAEALKIPASIYLRLRAMKLQFHPSNLSGVEFRRPNRWMSKQERSDQPLFFRNMLERSLVKPKRNKEAYVATVAVCDSDAAEAAWF